MRPRIVLIALSSLVVSACVAAALKPVPVAVRSAPVSYVADVQPIFNARCAVCHSCYNSACQVKLTSYEGVDRGGTKAPVYSGARLLNAAPTRLFMDANSTAEWRDKGFYSVTESTSPEGTNDSLMLHLLAAKTESPVPAGEYRAEAEDLTCAADKHELGKFLARHPDRGMPFGFPPLSDEDYRTLSAWLESGAPGPTEAEQAALTTPSAKAAAKIREWEAFLNTPGPKHAMTARYLYEHFFLAHIVFRDADPTQFFQLVRSTTPPGEAISVVATVRPYDPPAIEPVYYRLRKIHSTIVYKTHIVLEVTDDTLARYRELFIDTPWLEEPHWVPDDDKTGANPFVVYAQIPPTVRYRFLLDHSEFFIRTFIRGPVCKGQIALNVINDHFWVMFRAPEADLTVQHPEFLLAQAKNLRLPNEKGSDGSILKSFSDDYRERYVRFYRAKSELYDEKTPNGPGLDAIWKGRRAEDAPVLTIYRHFDSASVHKGVLGDLPRTVWVIDYPQFERIYYSLVAGFDVFGNLNHQVSVRRYMDYLRIEGELNFLEFLPSSDRMPMLRSWYIGADAIDNVSPEAVHTGHPTEVPFTTDDPKRELMEMVVNDHIRDDTGIEFDLVNYQAGGEPVAMPRSFETHEDILNGFRALTAPGTAFIRHHHEFGANLLYVRVRNYDESDRMFSIVINRWHDNVNSLFGESDRLDPSKDTMDFIPGSVGAYPNYFFVVDGADVPDFFDLLENFDGSEDYRRKLRKYGVNRSDADFWETYDWFQARMNETDPISAGLYDLNRYHPVAVGE